MSARAIRFLTNLAFISLGALLLCLPAFYNGFPIVSSDSGTYISCCFEHDLPVDRPVAYAFFIRHLSLEVTLWLPLIFQALIVSSVIHSCFRFLAGCSKPGFYFIITVAFLSSFSLLPVYASMLMTDILTPLVLLCGALLLYGKAIPLHSRIFFGAVFIFSCLSHLSNLLTAMAVFSSVALIAFFFRKTRRDFFFRSLRLLSLFPIAFLLLLLLNYNVGHRWELSPAGRNVFLLNRLVQMDMVNDYLDKHCEKEPVSLCKYRDHLDPNSDFLWDPSSPLSQEYGWENRGWEKAAAEYGPLVKAILSEPGNKFRFAKKACADAGLLLRQTGFVAGAPQTEDSPPHLAISWHLKHDLPAFKAARQFRQGLNFSLAESINRVVTIVSLAGILLLLLFRYSRMEFSLRGLLLLTAFYFLTNALVCAVFATVDPRYNTRLLWLLPFLLVLSVYQLSRQGKADTAR